MENILSKLVLCICFVGCILSCNLQQQEINTHSVHNENDTISEAHGPKHDQPLPDTVFQSVKMMMFKITITDSTMDGTIHSYDNLYEGIDGILTFRGMPNRIPHFTGAIKGRPSEIKVDWSFKTDYDTVQTKSGVWGGGNGWTGQPLYINWDDPEVKRRLKRQPDSTFKGKEIIISSLCGYVYFLDYETGKQKRMKVLVNNPVKGTAMLDPTMNGNLYVGQGIPRTTPFNPVVINVFQNRVIQHLQREPDIWRGWNAFDSSPIATGKFVFWAGENGTIYKFSRDTVGLKLHSKLQYKVGAQSAPGIESSTVVYRNYGYTADNHGNILCFNLNNMQPVWLYQNQDDTDGTILLEEDEEGNAYLYSGCEVDKMPSPGYSRFIKLNALTGELIWKQEFACTKSVLGEKSFDGGMYSTPLLGGGNCSEMIFTNIVTNRPFGTGDFVAISKSTGQVIYRIPLKWYAWSSPVALYNERGEMFIFTGDTQGRAYVFDGKTGEILINRKIGLNFEASPIIIDNKVIIGSRGTGIFKLRIECKN
ncbi:MAG: dehydrogenase [Chlorobi bacterium]|nr:MAG: dehydrogenase [Bacteroidota bacterium]MBL1162067.1 dehydrogenase [Chlorobiota bacterium]MBV6463377.1 Outer membrane protein assembly factor BamB [Chlorobiota bacterium]MBZ0194080.1 dehydrogenase [Candidatus Kapabacteria bacterium]QOJ27090.1 MAG: dehydrogenase [Ignavibacteria bacterium]